jgi:hypothetical protein
MDPSTVPPIGTPPQDTPAAPVNPMPMPFQPVPSSSPPMPMPSQLPSVPPVMPQTQNANSIISGGSEKKKLGGFGLFVIIAIVILLSIWGFVAYLYFGNKNKSETDSANQTITEVSPTTPPFNPNEIQISNGDISRLSSVGESLTLVKKEDYPGSSLIGFSHVAVSPDNTRLCFESIPPASDPTLYMSSVDGTNVETVVKNKHTCTWSPDNNFLFYVNDTLGNKQIDIYAYSLTSKEERNLTEKTSTKTEIRQYTIGSVDGSTLNCSYDIVNISGKKISSSNCAIDLVSGEVTDAAVVGTP